MSEQETINIDYCECIYCGHKFSGRTACNADMDCNRVECSKCKKEMHVLISVEYTCVPLDELEGESND